LFAEVVLHLLHETSTINEQPLSVTSIPTQTARNYSTLDIGNGFRPSSGLLPPRSTVNNICAPPETLFPEHSQPPRCASQDSTCPSSRATTGGTNYEHPATQPTTSTTAQRDSGSKAGRRATSTAPGATPGSKRYTSRLTGSSAAHRRHPQQPPPQLHRSFAHSREAVAAALGR